MGISDVSLDWRYTTTHKPGTMSEANTSEYGGKGAALMQLQEAGFNVPRFVILPVSLFERLTVNDGGLQRRIIEACNTSLSEWRRAFNSLPIAVRSSAVSEDSSAHSFAGQFKTLLNVPIENVPEA